MTKVAFVGLGVMGYPMAGHLYDRDFSLLVYNRTAQKAQKFCEQFKNAQIASLERVAEEADVIAMCLGDDPDVRAVADILLENIRPKTVIIDHTTTSPSLARELGQRCSEKEAHFIDAPVSGGEAGAQKGALSVMCGGEKTVIDRVQPVMDSYSARIVHIGPQGHGQLCKAVNQICIAGLLQGLAEGMAFGRDCKLDMEKVLSAIGGGAAQSWQMDNRANTMVEDVFDFGFAVDWMRKDLRIALEEARAQGITLPVTALVDQFYGDIQKSGGGRWDTSSLIKRL